MRAVEVVSSGVQLVVGLMACVSFVASLGCVLEEGGSDEEDVFEQERDMFNSEAEPPVGEEPDSQDPDPTEPPVQQSFSLSGVVDGTARSGHVVVLWYVTSGESPYFYYHGSGAIREDGTWSLKVDLDEDGRLPAEAVNSDGVATAMVLGVTAWDPAEQEAWGTVSWDEFRALETRTFAVSKVSALVFIEPGSNPNERHSWASLFTQDEMTCGADLSGDGIEPIPCASFVLEATRELSWLRL